MQSSINRHRDSIQKQSRVHPATSNLTVDTNSTTLSKNKSPWQQLFSAREKSLPEIILKNNKRQSSLPTPPSYEDDSHKSMSSTDSRNSSMDTLTTSSPKSSQGKKGSQVLKKIHVPHFSKKSNSTSSALVEYLPVLPEPVMPTIVNWSPEMPVSPPPWELEDNSTKNQQIKQKPKRYTVHVDQGTPSFFTQEPKTYEDHESFSTVASHSDSDLFDHHTRTSSITMESSDYSLSTTSRSSIDPTTPSLHRRNSCPNFEHDVAALNDDKLSSSSTLVEKDIIYITELHTREVTLLKKNHHVAEKRSPFKPCQRAKERASEAAHYGETISTHGFFFDTLCEDTLKYLYIPNLFDPVTREPIVEFATIKPRKYQLYRKTNWKREAKAMLAWRHSLEERLILPLPFKTAPVYMPPDKAERNLLTRKFILREFFMTEVSFWNQLYYTKTVFYDSLCFAIDNGSLYAKPSHSDIFAHLFDLMQFSAKLIDRLRRLHLQNMKEFDPFSVTEDDIQKNAMGIDCNGMHVGKIILDMAEDFVVFLRCAVDYQDNKKQIDVTSKNQGFLHFQQKLATLKSAKRFGLKDYLIIPIQRAARYGLLLSDLLKHSDSTHPDYQDLIKAYHLVTSLTSAMDSAQKKSS